MGESTGERSEQDSSSDGEAPAEWWRSIDSDDPCVVAAAVFDAVVEQPSHENLVFVDQLLQSYPDDARWYAAFQEQFSIHGEHLTQRLMRGES